MPLPEPQFDSRRYRDIVTEALARIPVHNPEWTNQLDSDPGVTLLQLFAFMTESIIYRANLIPERNRAKFLRLLGIPMRAAAPATGLVTFSKARGTLEVVTLETEQEVKAGSVPFRTENGLDVLPIEARLYYKSRLGTERREEIEEIYRQLYASFETDEQTLDFYETLSFELPEGGATLPVLDLAADTRDGVAWLALFARPKEDPDAARREIANHVLTLGILPALDEEGCVIYPLGPPPTDGGHSLAFEVPKTDADSPAYVPLAVTADEDPLARPGVVEVELPAAESLGYWDDLDPLEAGTGRYPPSLEDTEDGERLISWIRIRPRQVEGEESGSGQLKVALSWIGINAARVVQRARVTSERLPDGDGEPDQSATLVKTPVIAETLALTVNGEIWSEIDDLAAAPPEVPPRSPRLASAALATPGEDPDSHVYALDLEAGEIRFGDGARGMRPPFGATIQASYCYGGGLEGVVDAGAINRGQLLPSGVEVINPVPTWGGAAAETIAEAQLRVPAFLRHRDRLVSAEDFEEIARGTPGVEMGRVEILPLFYPELPKQDSEGVVTVMVIPASDPEQPDAPVPDRLFLETVCRYLEPRRVVTTELHVRGPVYQSLWVSAGIDVVPGRDIAPVREAVSAELRTFLSPLAGGFEGDGWPLGKAVEALELWAAATRVDGVAKVNSLLLAGPSRSEVDRVEMSGLDLPRLRAVTVESGDPVPLAELLGEPELQPFFEIDEQGQPTTVEVEMVPVPVVPKEC